MYLLVNIVRFQESALEAIPPPPPKFAVGAIVKANFGVPVRSHAKLVIRKVMYVVVFALPAGGTQFVCV